MNRCYVKSLLYDGQTAQAGAVTVGDGGSLDIVLGPYNAQLSVRAVDRDGNPVPGARITAVPKETGAANVQMGGMTTQSGQATMMSLRPGTYDVYAFETPDPNSGLFPPIQPGATQAYEGRGKTVTVGESGRTEVEVTVIPASETGAAAAPPPGPKGSLAGKVVNVVNGSPMAGVVVTLRGMFSPAAAAQAPSAATDDQGRFAFPDVAPGAYNVAAAEQRFLAAGAGQIGGFINQVVVGDGQQVSAFVLKLAPAGVIAGTVKDESGEPVLGALVEAYRYRNEMNQRRLASVGGTRTDDLGAYRITNLQAGDYYLRVQRAQPARAVANRVVPMAGAQPAASNVPAPESITGPLPSEPETDYVPLWYPNAAQRSGASSVKLAVGATAANIDMTWRTSRTVRIRGKVTDPSGGAVGTPQVTLREKDAEAMLSNIGSVMAARDGSFEISGVPSGSYWLTAWPAPTAGVAGGMAVSGPGGASTKRAVQSIEVKDASIEGIQLELSFGRTVRGSVKMDGGGATMRPAVFSLTSLDSQCCVTINPGADGTFTAGGVFPGTYALNTQNLPANSYVKSMRYGGKDVSPTGFELTGDGQLEIVLSNAAAVLEGSITGADGKPDGLAGVVVAPASGGAPVRTGNADAAGNYYFASLPPGDYRVVAWDASAPEAFDPPEALAPFARYAKTVTLTASAHEKLPVTVVPAAR
jgi:protocatechuate 3,4-dioxygenase beta subunit